MKITTKTLAAAAIAVSTAAGASAVTTTSANALALNTGSLNAESVQKGAKNGSGVQNVHYRGIRRCYRIPRYRWRWTPFGWRRVFAGYRLRCRTYYRRHHHGPRFRIHLSF